jgi:hypothetical protein
MLQYVRRILTDAGLEHFQTERKLIQNYFKRFRIHPEPKAHSSEALIQWKMPLSGGAMNQPRGKTVRGAGCRNQRFWRKWGPLLISS